MILLNSIAMFAAAAIAVPIVIHLRKRTRSKVIDWGAMRFLSESVVNRRKGLMLEHLLLLGCRCLLIAAFALAMARPFVSSVTDLSWIVALVLFALSLIVLVVAAVLWNEHLKRWVALGMALLLFSFAAMIVVFGIDKLAVQWAGKRDVAVIIDGSPSMKIQTQGKSNYQRAIEAAQQLVRLLPGGSTVTIVDAGNNDPKSTPRPLKNLRRAEKMLGQLTPTGGSLQLPEFIERSKKLLEKGVNSEKQIVVFSDNQLNHWQEAANAFSSISSEQDQPQRPETKQVKASNARTVSKLAESEGSDSEKPLGDTFCRVYKLPKGLENVSVVRIEPERKVMAVGRTSKFSVRVQNTGAVTLKDVRCQFWVDGKQVDSQTIAMLESGAVETLVFQHSFDSPGGHVVSAKTVDSDQLSDDNVCQRTVHVKESLPVLIVNGRPAEKLFKRASAFAQLALDPSSFDLKKDRKVGSRGVGKDGSGSLITVDVIDAPDIVKLDSFNRYQVVLLTEVPRLSADVSQRLAAFVASGGGLFVIPGVLSDPEFYNQWRQPESDEPLMPAKLTERVRSQSAQDGQLRALALDTDSFSHPSLKRIADRGQHDLFDLLVTTHWVLDVQALKSPVVIGAKLANEDPFFVEQKFGRGRVLLAAVSLNVEESNLPLRESFPVLMHMLVYHLAAAHKIDLNYASYSNLVVEFPLYGSDVSDIGHVKMQAPDGKNQDVATSIIKGKLAVDVGTVSHPGVYRLQAARDAKSRLEHVSLSGSIPFTVAYDAREHDLTAANDKKFSELCKLAGITEIQDDTTLQAIAEGKPSGFELSRYCVLAALGLVVLEVITSRWIMGRRVVETALTSSSSTSNPEPFRFPKSRDASLATSDLSKSTTASSYGVVS